MPRVLLVDDDTELSAMLAEYLEQDGFEARPVADGERAVEEALSGRWEIVVLDVMMPRLNGVEVLRRIRRASQVPILMLTAVGSEMDRVMGLELGADDYVPKPCTPRELAARLRAILRRTQPAEAPAAPVVAGRLAMWPERRTAEWSGRPLALTSTEFNILAVLARSAGHVVSKAELSEQALGRPLERFERSIDVHVSSLRQKLGPLDDGRSAIQTVRGQGFLLVKE